MLDELSATVDGQDNAAADQDQEDEEEGSTTPPPVKAKAKKMLERVEADEVMAKALDNLDAGADEVVRVAKALDASGTHDLRKDAFEATMDQIEAGIRVAKLGGLQPVHYPHGQGEDVLQNHQVERPTVTQFADRSQRTVTPAVQSPGRHQFDNLVDQVKARDGCSRSKAFTTARLENPGVYEAYQNWHSGNTTQEQRAVQQETNDPTNKSAPTSYETLVAAEMRKGFSPQVAAQRVSTAYGMLPGDESIAKEANAYQELREAAQGMLDENSSMPRTEALRKARLKNEALYKALNAV